MKRVLAIAALAGALALGGMGWGQTPVAEAGEDWSTTSLVISTDDTTGTTSTSVGTTVTVTTGASHGRK